MGYCAQQQRQLTQVLNLEDHKTKLKREIITYRHIYPDSGAYCQCIS